jgi:hypothetical protein
MGAAKQTGRFLSGYYDQAGLVEFDALGQFKDLQKKVQGSSTQLSAAFMQETESLALLNAQYADGLITKEDYDAQMAVSSSNFSALGDSSKKLISELDKIDKSGELSADALKGLGDEAFAALKKSNPELFKRLAKYMKDLDGASQIDIMMGYAQGSLTILDIAKLPDLLDQIDGKTVEAAINILANAGVGAGVLEADIREQLAVVDSAIKNYKGPKTGSEAYAYYQLLDRRKGLAAQIAKIEASKKVNQKGSLDSDNANKGTGTDGTGKFINPYEKELDLLKKKRDALKEVNDELDRQNQYQMKQLDLINQAAKAKMTGDYLQAASLQQQSLLEGSKFARESKIIQMDRIIGQTEDRSKIVSDTKKLTSVDQTLLKKLRAKDYSGIAALPTTPNIGFGAKPGASGTSGTNIGGTVYNVTMNVTGSNAEEISTKVLAKIKLMENKSNKTNRVPL